MSRGADASLYLGKCHFAYLESALVSFWAKLLNIRYQFLYPGILLFAFWGL